MPVIVDSPVFRFLKLIAAAAATPREEEPNSVSHDPDAEQPAST